MADAESLIHSIIAVCDRWEQMELFQQAARAFGGTFADAIPRTFVGPRYGVTHLEGIRIPKLLVLGINQSDKGPPPQDAEAVRNSLRSIHRCQDGRIAPDGFGPRGLAVNLARGVLIECGVPPDALRGHDAVHDLIAYDNFVKWATRKESDIRACDWRQFYGLNYKILGVLQPDLVICLGASLFHPHLWRAMEVGLGHKLHWQPLINGWASSLDTTWGRCRIGKCYHYAATWTFASLAGSLEQGIFPKPMKSFFPDQKVSTSGLSQEAAAAVLPWWDSDSYDGLQFTNFPPLAKFAAAKVTQALVSDWQKSL